MCLSGEIDNYLAFFLRSSVSSLLIRKGDGKWEYMRKSNLSKWHKDAKKREGKGAGITSQATGVVD